MSQKCLKSENAFNHEKGNLREHLFEVLKLYLNVLVDRACLGDGGHGLLADAGVAALVEGADGDVEAGVLPDDLHGVLVRVEAVHEDEGHVGVVLLVEELNLLHRQVQERQVGPHRDHRLGTTENG